MALGSLFRTTQRDIRPPDDFGGSQWANPNSEMAQYAQLAQGLGGASMLPSDMYERYMRQMVNQLWVTPPGSASEVFELPAGAVAAKAEVMLEERTEQPRPVPITPTVPADYNAIALELGFEPKVLNDARLHDRLIELGIPVYDYAQVDAYLRHLKSKAKADIWCWRPLRPKDVLKEGWGAKQTHKGGVIGVETKWLDGSYGPGRPHSAPYDRLVPKRALERTVAIVRKLGDEAAFFVSDFASPKVEISDPFIMVVMRRDPSIRAVFDVWNEPGFDVPPIEGT